MAYIVDPQIIIPSFSEAINQLANITLNRLGVDINSLPFWLSVFGYPLVMFEVFTKHIATAINVLLRKAHMKTVLLIRVVFQLTITLSILTIVALTALYHSEYASIVGNISKPILTTTFKYLIAVTFIVTTILLLSSLSYLTGQGNQVAGIGFISSTTGLFIESVQNFGFTAKIMIIITSIVGILLWYYGNKYNKHMEQRVKKQSNILDDIQKRRSLLKNI